MATSWDGRSPVGYGIGSGLIQGVDNFTKNFVAGQAAQQAAAEALADRNLREKIAMAHLETEKQKIAQAEKFKTLDEAMKAIHEGRPEAISGMHPATPEQIAKSKAENAAVSMKNQIAAGEMAAAKTPQLQMPEFGHPSASPTPGSGDAVLSQTPEITTYQPKPTMALNAPKVSSGITEYTPAPTTSPQGAHLYRAAEQSRSDKGEVMLFNAREKYRLEGEKQKAITERAEKVANLQGKWRNQAAAIAAAPANERNRLAKELEETQRRDVANYAIEHGLVLGNGEPDMAAADSEITLMSKPTGSGMSPEKDEVKMYSEEVKAKEAELGRAKGRKKDELIQGVVAKKLGAPAPADEIEQAKADLANAQAKLANAIQSRKGGAGNNRVTLSPPKMTRDQVKAAHPTAPDWEIDKYLRGEPASVSGK